MKTYLVNYTYYTYYTNTDEKINSKCEIFDNIKDAEEYKEKLIDSIDDIIDVSIITLRPDNNVNSMDTYKMFDSVPNNYNFYITYRGKLVYGHQFFDHHSGILERKFILMKFTRTNDNNKYIRLLFKDSEIYSNADRFKRRYDNIKITEYIAQMLRDGKLGVIDQRSPEALNLVRGGDTIYLEDFMGYKEDFIKCTK